jgi:RHS repeat-associated protein
MAGDTILPGVQCYYVSNTPTDTNSSFNSVLNSLASAITGIPTGGAEGILSNYTSPSGTVFSGLASFLSTKDLPASSGYPKAYLNWILLDDQFNYVSGSSGSVATASTIYPANQMNPVAPGSPIVMGRNGYLYVWVSNETEGWDVFFDNFSVLYKQGPVLEENHYYPFGLTMAGISDMAVKTNYAENKYRWNKGSELQNKEFSDGSELEMYETQLRELDPQLGKWWQIDSKPDTSISPYTSMGNDPILHNDPKGDTLVFPNPGSGFQNLVFQTIETMVSKGGGQNIANLAASKQNINVVETDAYDAENGSHYDANTNTIYWNPHQGLLSTNGTAISPATSLEHEADHGLANLTDPNAYETRSHTSDANYTNAEEARVIKGSEQVTARTLGETKDGKPTRTDHTAVAVYRAFNPFQKSGEFIFWFGQ